MARDLLWGPWGTRKRQRFRGLIAVVRVWVRPWSVKPSAWPPPRRGADSAARRARAEDRRPRAPVGDPEHPRSARAARPLPPARNAHARRAPPRAERGGAPRRCRGTRSAGAREALRESR